MNVYFKQIRHEKKKERKVHKLDYYFICEKCALDREGSLPKGHCFTCCEGTCEYCKTENVTLIPIVDFNWPWDNDYIYLRD